MKKLHPAGAVWLNGHWLTEATTLDGNHYTVSMGDVLIVENDNVFIPALWMKNPSIFSD